MSGKSTHCLGSTLTANPKQKGTVLLSSLPTFNWLTAYCMFENTFISKSSHMKCFQQVLAVCIQSVSWFGYDGSDCCKLPLRKIPHPHKRSSECKLVKWLLPKR